MAEAQKEMAEESERNKEQWISVASSRSKVSLRIFSISPSPLFYLVSALFPFLLIFLSLLSFYLLRIFLRRIVCP